VADIIVRLAADTRRSGRSTAGGPTQSSGG
jgi:hypothetical protein